MRDGAVRAGTVQRVMMLDGRRPLNNVELDLASRRLPHLGAFDALAQFSGRAGEDQINSRVSGNSEYVGNSIYPSCCFTRGEPVPVPCTTCV